MTHRILIVDDEPRVLDGLKRVFRREPYEVLTANSAEEGLRVLASTDVDVVISDHQMPGMLGTDFLYIVAREFPSTIRYMLTGKPSLEVAIQAINDGAISRFYTKPCHELDLIISIRSALQQKALISEAMRLLRRYKNQQAKLERIQRDYPEAASALNDTEGAQPLESMGNVTYEDLIDELRRTFGD
ncbi:MAG: response regulator [Candidatus Hydrogenedentes bacterium]|nr:response regulator [Candidatus Hydrogenedentota bacterium]